MKKLLFFFLILALFVQDLSAENPWEHMLWRVRADGSIGWVPGTNDYLKGFNESERRIASSWSAAAGIDFSFNPVSDYGRMYRGLYQGLGTSIAGFTPGGLLGTPVGIYVYQGAPVLSFGKGWSIDYEWQFGAACGWRVAGNDVYFNNAVSTSVTAHMAVGFKIAYSVSPRWQLSAGIRGTHYSNGNTHWPNRGVNTVGASVGVSYLLSGRTSAAEAESTLPTVADDCRWMFDIVAYGAWRKRGLVLNDNPVLVPGKFMIAGLQFAPLRRFSHWFAAGPALD
ncbi:MAG: acyloxyacyl hydrolase, partial [Muribaculaceae bacterium]|nr:acyloxyacyl hydrolase [Muribaculaceae bacterium]